MFSNSDHNANKPPSKAFAWHGALNHHNQGVNFGAVFLWNDLRFGSLSEIEIAKALDKAGAWFVPNCKLRISGLSGRENREPTFLVGFECRLGVLQIDDPRSDLSLQTDLESIREQMLFQINWIPVVKHFHWEECLLNSDQVVEQFLQILGGAS